ncbi:MAG TPA: DEAD/DEAH box helicase, partial [Deltaproteobacteria bacterium]|nr:DEAD/DEAH box helicase [Deltaproteobacteria bacterium]
LLQRYIGDPDAMIVDRLGGTRWVKAKAHARESARRLAGELLAIYAKRECATGFSFDVAHPSIKEFEDDFPYEETDDQLKTIEDVYADMASRRPMDRLVCGDVGYGKTEVALRSAFVAAMNGKQAAILVPTTLLARQHLATFRARFERWPLRVEGLSSFGGTQSNKAVLADVAQGKVDVVIGTQTLLSDAVKFKDLGLLVIDEEHRFGVKDKEKIKSLRAEIDILTLTATPIPRTLNMAISGIRDMSIIETPPVDRKSIETVISRFDDDTIMQAVEREFARGGQVFFVHNQVANIEEMADYIQSICPHARVGVAHGQMCRRELERIMERFLDRRINLLVSSAIIGSGIDISTANTIIINRADKFGLADLYQLRGRVGRSKTRGYALLLIPAVGQITKDAHKRLSAIKEYESLGAGFQMALRDMEIRGVGDILGHAQWGQVTAIGFELYQQMLKEAVDTLRGVQTAPELDPEIRIDRDAYIPDEYCPDQHLRLGIYKRLSTASAQEITEIHDELFDMFGPVPGPLKTLLAIAEIRDLMRGLRIRKLEWEDALLKLYFAHDTMVNIEALVELVTKHGGRMAPEGLAELKAAKIEGVLAMLHGLNDRDKG